MEPNGNFVDVRPVFVVEEIVEGEPGDVQRQVQHVGLEMLVQVPARTCPDYGADDPANDGSRARYSNSSSGSCATEATHRR